MTSRWDKFLSKMKKYSVEMEENMSFSSLTTLGCGGKIKVTLFPTSIQQLVLCLKFTKKYHIKRVVLGAGSNVLAGDSFFDGAVIVTKKLNKLTLQGTTAVAECGVSTPYLFCKLAEKGLTGGEFLSCLPATIGGATVCNAGCFGQSMQQIVSSVTVWQNGKIRTLNVQQCNFNKRSSAFKNTNSVVLCVKLQFQQSTCELVNQLANQFRTQKRQTQPLGAKSAGCVFFHPTVAVSALIDKAGLKGYRVGDAKISQKHAGFVINIDKAVAKDIYLLIVQILNILTNNFGVQPQLEICLVNITKEQDDIFATSKGRNTQIS